MKTESEKIQRWEDIIFEKRNKEYGAYAIRKNYNSNVLRAEAISIGIGVLVFIIPILLQKENVLIPPIKPDLPPLVLDHYIHVEPTITPPEPLPPRRVDASIIPTTPTTREIPDEPVEPLKQD